MGSIIVNRAVPGPHFATAAADWVARLEQLAGLERDDDAPSDPGTVARFELADAAGVAVEVMADHVRLEHVYGSPPLDRLRAILHCLGDAGLRWSSGPRSPWPTLRLGVSRRDHLLDVGSDTLRARLDDPAAAFHEDPPAGELAPAHLDLALRERAAAAAQAFGGVTFAGLRIGAHADAGQSTQTHAHLLATAPFPAEFWLDTHGTIHDDTDGELTVPIADSPVELLEYWAAGFHGALHNPPAHRYIVTVRDVPPHDLAARLATARTFAWGPTPAVWTPAAARFAERHNFTTSTFTRSATVSCPDERTLAKVLATLTPGSPLVRLDSPEPAALPRAAGTKVKMLVALDRTGRPLRLAGTPDGQVLVERG